jgi:hypothetical protein
MASLTANVAVFAGIGDYVPIPMRCAGANEFYRGGLVFYAAGQITPLVADTNSEFAGIVAERVTTTAANDFVLVYTSGIFLLANTNFTIANQGSLFFQTVAGEDDPATLNVTAAGDSGACGRLLQVKTTAVDGYLDISDRFDVSNTA